MLSSKKTHCLVLVLATIIIVADIFQLNIFFNPTSRFERKNENIEMTLIFQHAPHQK